MTKNFILDVLKVCVKHGYLPDNVLRNMEIKFTYDEMRKNGISCKKARENLAETYFISVKNVEAILYNKHKTRSEIER